MKKEKKKNFLFYHSSIAAQMLVHLWWWWWYIFFCVQSKIIINGKRLIFFSCSFHIFIVCSKKVISFSVCVMISFIHLVAGWLAAAISFIHTQYTDNDHFHFFFFAKMMKNQQSDNFRIFFLQKFQQTK